MEKFVKFAEVGGCWAVVGECRRDRERDQKCWRESARVEIGQSCQGRIVCFPVAGLKFGFLQPAVDAEVAKLLDAKKRYKAATRKDWTPDAAAATAVTTPVKSPDPPAKVEEVNIFFAICKFYFFIVMKTANNCKICRSRRHHLPIRRRWTSTRSWTRSKVSATKCANWNQPKLPPAKTGRSTRKR